MKRYIDDPYLYERRQARRAGFSTKRLLTTFLGPLVKDGPRYWYSTERSDYDGSEKLWKPEAHHAH